MSISVNLKRVLVDIIRQYPFSVNGNDNEYVFDLIAKAFPKVITKRITAGLALQKVVKRVLETKPNKAAALELFPLIKTVIEYFYNNIKTKQKIFGDLRKVVREKYGAQAAVYEASKTDLAIDHDEYLEVTAQTTERRDAKNADCKQYDRGQILGLMQQLKGSSSFEDEVILTALATGSRFIEILRESEFLPVRGDVNAVKIKGVAKKKNTEELYEFIKPLVFLRNNELRAVVDDLRKLSLAGDGSEIDNEELTGRYNSRVNKRLKQLGFDGTVHDLRRVYGSMSYEQAPDKDKISLNEWLKQVLGHTKAETSLHYTNVHLNEGEPQELKIVDDANIISFKVGESTVFIKKVSKRRINNWAERKQVIDELAREMKEKGVKVTNLNLRKLGVGADSANRYIKEL